MLQRLPIRAALLATLCGLASPTHAQVYPSIGPNTVLGRLGASQPGPPQAIPFAALAGALAPGILNSLCQTDGAFPIYNATTGAWLCSTNFGVGTQAKLDAAPLTINASGFPLQPVVAGENAGLVLSGRMDGITQGETILYFDTYGANSNGTIVFNKSGGGAIFNGTISGTVLTVNSVTFGSLADNQVLMANSGSGTQLALNTQITACCGTGGTTGNGGTGTYLINPPQNIVARNMLSNDPPTGPTATQNAELFSFIVSQGWYNNSGTSTRTNATSAFMQWTECNFTSSCWATSFRFQNVLANSTTLVHTFSIAEGGTPGVRVYNDGIGNSPGDGTILTNTTAATSGAQLQNSPSVRWNGQVWNTGASASWISDWTATEAPTAGNPPITSLVFSYRLNSTGTGSFTRAASVNSYGLDAVSGYSINSATPSAGHVLIGDGSTPYYYDGQVAFSNLTGSATCSQLPTLTGDATTSAGSCVDTVVNVTSGATFPGFYDFTQTAAPSNPASGHDRIFMSTTDTLKVLNSSGNITSTVAPISVVSHQFLTGLNNGGVFSQAQPSSTDLSDAGAWSTFTPSLSCGTATFTVNSAQAKTNILSKTTVLDLDFTISSIGTCTTPITYSLPNTANSSAMISGQETANNGSIIACSISGASSTSTCRRSLGTSYAANDHIIVSGVYQNQ